MEMVDKGHVKLKCPEKVEPTKKKPYPEGQFFQCLQCFEAPGCSSGYINLRTFSNKKYWEQHKKETTHKLVVQINQHNEEQIKIGKTKRQRQSVIHAFSVVMKKWKSQGDRDNTESVEESDKQKVCIPINNKTDCVGVLNSVNGKWRIQISMINKYGVIS